MAATKIRRRRIRVGPGRHPATTTRRAREVFGEGLGTTINLSNRKIAILKKKAKVMGLSIRGYVTRLCTTTDHV